MFWFILFTSNTNGNDLYFSIFLESTNWYQLMRKKYNKKKLISQNEITKKKQKTKFLE